MQSHGTDPSLERDSYLGLVGDEADGGAQHLVLSTLNSISLDTDHLPADLLKRQDLDHYIQGCMLDKCVQETYCVHLKLYSLYFDIKKTQN